MVEADFQREYQIDLNPALVAGISWRRFCVLFGALGPNSLWAALHKDEPVDPDAGELDNLVQLWAK